MRIKLRFVGKSLYLSFTSNKKCLPDTNTQGYKSDTKICLIRKGGLAQDRAHQVTLARALDVGLADVRSDYIIISI